MSRKIIFSLLVALITASSVPAQETYFSAIPKFSVGQRVLHKPSGRIAKVLLVDVEVIPQQPLVVFYVIEFEDNNVARLVIESKLRALEIEEEFENADKTNHPRSGRYRLAR